MKSKNISADPRTLTGRKVKTLKKAGIVPANVFGKNIASVNIQLDAKTFAKIYSEVGESTLLELQIKDEKAVRPVMVSQVVYQPVSGALEHVTFHQVNLKEKVTAPVKIELSGKSPAVADGIGVLVQQLDEVEVSALPADMPDKISLDIQNLTEVGSSISVGDINLGTTKVTLITNLETLIVKIEPLAKEEVVTPPPTAEVPESETAVPESPESAPPAPETAKP